MSKSHENSPSAKELREYLDELGIKPTDKTEQRLQQMEAAEEGDVVAEANLAADDKDFDRTVTKPVNIISEFEGMNPDQRITAQQLKQKMEEAGYKNIPLEKLRDTIQAYYGE